MTRTVVIEPRDLADIRRRGLFLLDRSAAAALKWYKTIDSAMVTLEHDADWHARIPEGPFPGRDVRRILIGKRQHKHRVIYEIAEQEVRVLHVRHGMQRRLRRMI